MTYEQFWNSGLDKFWTYSRAYNKKRKTEEQDRETQAWQIGNYMMAVFQAQPIISLMPAKMSDVKFNPYPKNPKWIDREETKTEIKKERKKLVKPTNKDLAEYNRKMKDLKQRAKK